MKIPLVDLKRQYLNIKEEIDKAIQKVIDSSSFILGPEVKEFEENLAKYLGVKYCVGVKSGTSALLLSLKALDIKEGDEVITVPNTFIATAEAITNVGAKVKFVDVDEDTHLMDVNKFKEAITKKTKAVIPVHLYGQCANMKDILKIAKEYNLKVIEDCAQALGAEHNGKKAGNFGDIGCFSFFPAKVLGAFGDGGIVATNNKELYDKVFLLRNHGRLDKYTHRTVGSNERLDTLQAAILNVKLKYLDNWIEKRRNIAKSYNDLLKTVMTPMEAKNGKHVYYVYTIRCKNREKLQKYLEENGIASQIYYPTPLHLQPAYKGLGYKKGDFPIAEKLANEILAIPMFPELTKEEINYICGKVNNCSIPY